MIVINNVYDGLINTILNSSGFIKQRIIDYSGREFVESGKIEIVVLYGENIDAVEKSALENNIKFEDLGYGFGIITLDSNKIEKISLIDGLIYAELPKTLFTADYASNRACCVPELWTGSNLTGKGVLVGFVDTGIDYKHPAFLDENGNTRIKYIYDLSDNNAVYDENQINEAIRSKEPLSIVKEQDYAGHGTHVAGIACGRSNDKNNRGVAYDSFIAMVKTTRYGNINYALSTQIMRGIRFLVDKAAKDSLPLVINISMSTNDGAHNGRSILEQYIETICKLDKVNIVVAAGNEGDAGHHDGGRIDQVKQIDFSIAQYTNTLVFQLYKPLLTEISLEIINPQSESSGIIKIVQGYREFSIGSDRCILFFTGPKPFDINGEVVITLISTSDNGFDGGSWSMKLMESNTDKIDSEYNIWMPIREALDEDTRFLKPDPYFTIGIPATVRSVISVGSYDYLTNTISIFSGRGAQNQNIYNNKPDLVAPGNDIYSSVPGGQYDTKTGTSMASPHVTGIAALLMQWGIVENKDPFLFGDRLKYFLLKGASRDRDDVIYPSPVWGYGKVCASNSLRLLRVNDLRGNNNYRQNKNESIYQDQNYYSVIVEFKQDMEKELQDYDNVYLYKLTDKFGILTAPYKQMNSILRKLKFILDVEYGAIFTLTDVSPIEASKAQVITSNPYLNLSGNGVLVGIIDTGIDYLNEEFINEDGSSRILSLWDQTLINEKGNDSSLPDLFGKSFSKADITKAISAKKNGLDPYSIVESKDNNGHGTAMASIIGARGKNKDVTGVAPNCEFVIVKLAEIKEFMIDEFGLYGGTEERYETINVVFAIRYLSYIAKKYSKPMAVYVPLGTNYGGHDGTSIIESLLDSIAQNNGVIPVANVGNQGNTDTHAAGRIEKNNDIENIELNIGPLQKNLIFYIWINTPNKVSVRIISPSGESSPNVSSRLKNEQNYKYIYEGTELKIKIESPDQVTGDEKISVSFKNIRKGIWKIQLTGDYIVDCKYNSWLPQKELLAPDTKFLSSDQYTTLMVPSTGRNTITTAYYNQNTNYIVPSSGRGYTRDNRIKPEVSSGGINALVATPGGGITTISGASVAGAVTAGCITLILQWGIVNKNDERLYSKKVKTYLIRGTTKRDGDIYPNKESGYGFINLEGVFNNLRGNKDYLEYRKDNIFVRMPSK